MKFFHFRTRNGMKCLLVKFLDSVNQTVLYLSRRTFSGNRSILKQNSNHQVQFGNRTKRTGILLIFFSGNSKIAFYNCRETFPHRTFTIEEIIKTSFFATSLPDSRKFCRKFLAELSNMICVFPVENFLNEIFLWKNIDFSTFELKADKIRSFGNTFFETVLHTIFYASGQAFSETTMFLKSSCSSKTFLEIDEKELRQFRGKFFRGIPKTLFLVSRKIFCNTATLPHFWILSEQQSTTDEISSAVIPRVHST